MIFKKTLGGRPVKNEIFIIAGLGNPGPEYEKTRHNCGFRTLDRVAEALGCEVSKRKFKSVYGDCKTELGGKNVRIILLKPQTYMNNSGEAVSEAMDFFKVPEKNVIIIYDDCDLQAGALRIRPGGSAGTHNGMKSVCSYMKNDNFPRVRVGIGKRQPNADMIKFVLGTFPEEEEKIMQEAFKRAAEAALMTITDGCDRTMNKYNG